MQVSGVEQGVSTVPRRRQLAMLLAIATILVIAAVAALQLWVTPPATTSGVGAEDSSLNAGAGSAVIHDDAGSVH